jgi:hypothetical protein
MFDFVKSFFVARKHTQNTIGRFVTVYAAGVPHNGKIVSVGFFRVGVKLAKCGEVVHIKPTLVARVHRDKKRLVTRKQPDAIAI